MKSTTSFEARVALSLMFGVGMAAICVGPSLAGGFYAPYQSGPAIGTALAGCSARGDDPGFLFCNPATIASLPGAAVTIDARAYMPSVKIEASHAISPLGADITNGGGSGSLTQGVAAPGGFAAMPIAPRVWLGIGVSGHFAVDIKTDPGWAGRFNLLETNMRGTNLTAALAWRVTDWLTLAGGLQAQEFRAEFSKSEIIPTFFGPIEARGFLKGEGWAPGWVAGVLVTPADGTRIGLGYRSQLTHHLTGTAGIDLAFVPIDTARFDVKLPEVISIGIEQRLGPGLRLFGEAQWVHWSRFTGFDIAFGSGRPNEVRSQSWDDTWLVAGGLGYMLRPGTELTAGVHYDTAVTSGGSNTLSPDGARTMIGLGLSQRIAGSGVLSAHYAHVFFDQAAVNVSSPGSGTLVGEYKASLDIVGLSFKLDW